MGAKTRIKGSPIPRGQGVHVADFVIFADFAQCLSRPLDCFCRTAQKWRHALGFGTDCDRAPRRPSRGHGAVYPLLRAFLSKYILLKHTYNMSVRDAFMQRYLCFRDPVYFFCSFRCGISKLLILN